MAEAEGSFQEVWSVGQRTAEATLRLINLDLEIMKPGVEAEYIRPDQVLQRLGQQREEPIRRLVFADRAAAGRPEVMEGLRETGARVVLVDGFPESPPDVDRFISIVASLREIQDALQEELRAVAVPQSPRNDRR